MKKTIYFIRHCEPDYSQIKEEDNIAMTMLAPLSGSGKIDAKYIKEEINCFDKYILVSPYTRAIETALIFANDYPMSVEQDLHEWLPSKSFNAKASDFNKINKEYIKNNGLSSNIYDYETKQELKERVQKVINKYAPLQDKMIFVTHARLIAAFLDCKEPKYGQIIKYTYEWNDK